MSKKKRNFWENFFYPNKSRLRDDIRVCRATLRAQMEMGNRSKAKFFQRALTILDASDKANEGGETDFAWKLFHKAKRLAFYDFTDAELKAQGIALKSEAEAKKIKPWRGKAIVSLVEEAEKTSQSDQKKTLVHKAAFLRDVNADNGYRKALTIRTQTTFLIIILGGLFLVFMGFLAAFLEKNNTMNSFLGEVKNFDALFVFTGGFFLGTMGGGLSGLLALVKMDPKKGNLVDLLANPIATIGRPMVGGIGAIAIIFFLTGGIAPDSLLNPAELTLGTLWAWCFASGINERIVFGIAAWLGDRKKDTDQKK